MLTKDKICSVEMSQISLKVSQEGRNNENVRGYDQTNSSRAVHMS